MSWCGCCIANVTLGSNASQVSAMGWELSIISIGGAGWCEYFSAAEGTIAGRGVLAVILMGLG